MPRDCFATHAADAKLPYLKAIELISLLLRIRKAYMRRLSFTFAVMSCFLFWENAMSLASEPTAAGLWAQMGSDGRVGGWFLIAEQNGIYEGTLVKTFPAPTEDPNPTCTKCMGEEKNQPFLGLTIIKSMKRKGLVYEDGTILDPRDGSVYHALMQVSSDGQKLTVRGYLGISFLGRSQTWNRLPESAYAQIDPGTQARLQQARRAPSVLPRASTNAAGAR